MGTCGDCQYWDTAGFGLRDGPAWGSHRLATVGICKKVARLWDYDDPDKMIALIGTEHSKYSQLIEVVTRREFGCNQFKKRT